MTRTVVFAFLPVGCQRSEFQYIRIGYFSPKTSDGIQGTLHSRFSGLNSVREILFMIEVDSSRRNRVMDYLQTALLGPGTAIGGTLRIVFHETFKNALNIGRSWYRTRLPLADIRGFFYELADEICGGLVGHANPLYLAPNVRFAQQTPAVVGTESNEGESEN